MIQIQKYLTPGLMHAFFTCSTLEEVESEDNFTMKVSYNKEVGEKCIFYTDHLFDDEGRQRVITFLQYLDLIVFKRRARITSLTFTIVSPLVNTMPAS